MRAPLARAASAACATDFAYSAAFIPIKSPIFFTVVR